MTHPLTDQEKETLTRFDKWLKRVFRSHLPSFSKDIFSTRYHIDQWGNILIDNGRVRLTTPSSSRWDLWEARSLEDSTVWAHEVTLEQTLLQALSKALKRDFINNY